MEKRLTKSMSDKKIFGVCGGIAKYLNVDPTIVRIVIALLILGYGSGLLLYVICALVMPEGE